jgi:hypothetical protein
MKFILLVLACVWAVASADPTATEGTATPATADTTKPAAAASETIPAAAPQVEPAKPVPAPPAHEESEAEAGAANPAGYDEVFATSSERAIMSGSPDVLSTEILGSDSLDIIPDEMITKYQGGTRRVHLENSVFRREDPVVYDARGKRDPFRALVVDEKKEGAIQTDLLRLDGAVLTGVIWSDGEFVAMARDKESNSFLLHEGDPVYNGRCTAITKTQAVFDVVEFGDYQQTILKIASPDKPIKITG